MRFNTIFGNLGVAYFFWATLYVPDMQNMEFA